MLHRIKELFQKTSCQKTGKSGDNILNSHGNFALENPTQEHIQQNQHGRSMTEMLGVLAIMGVLSIGALAGYRYAMDKQRANATMNDINLRSVDLVIQASRNIPLNLDEWGTKSSAGYTFGTPEHVADGFVKLPISGLPERVCEMVVDGLSGQFDMDINGTQIGTGASCGDDNIITVYFDATGQGTHGEGDACGGCQGSQTCVDGVCVCTNGGTGENCEIDLCAGVSCGECQKCQNGFCVIKGDYESCTGGYCESGKCISNENAVSLYTPCTTDSDCGNSCSYCNKECLPKPNGASCGENGTCRNDGGWASCLLPCSDDRPLKDSSGACYSCNFTAPVSVSSESVCAKCGDERYYKDGKCYKTCADGQFKDSFGTCFSCDTGYSINVSSQSDCAVCGDKRYYEDGYCFRFCIAGEFNSFGSCFSCDANYFRASSESACAVCGDKRYYEDGMCYKTCADGQFKNSFGTCFSCDTGYSINVSSQSDCAVCGDKRYYEDGYCFRFCIAGEFNSNGSCFSCDTGYSINVSSQSDCAVCGDKRYYEDGMCYLNVSEPETTTRSPETTTR